ncbi:heavy-metal-associated domain-containing protein [Chlorobium sp. N1]|uniref:heavy-metal-associated domain-containing protein n=1 Tax=Chlorobium sp. N1 TaxID=2491138 RepID=UPI0010401851|nr:heavy-metal-associated domain-containing protein [Chlorobium sp. N1]TCD47911.1 copper chaperone [Chlorobium sp. N1]
MRIELKVEGMRCGGCERSVRDLLMELEGVSGTEASHDAGTVRVDYDPGLVSPEALKAVIRELGFRVAG